jgi:hypothetical protein
MHSGGMVMSRRILTQKVQLHPHLTGGKKMPELCHSLIYINVFVFTFLVNVVSSFLVEQ